MHSKKCKFWILTKNIDNLKLSATSGLKILHAITAIAGDEISWNIPLYCKFLAPTDSAEKEKNASLIKKDEKHWLPMSFNWPLSIYLVICTGTQRVQESKKKWLSGKQEMGELIWVNRRIKILHQLFNFNYALFSVIKCSL